MTELREAASFEGLIVLAVIYLVLNAISRAGRKPVGKPPAPPPVAEQGGTQQEAFSLEQVLREIERVKQAKQVPAGPVSRRPPAPPPRSADRAPPLEHPRAVRAGRMAPVEQDERGPLGRRAAVELPSAEDIEERTSFDEFPPPAAARRPVDAGSRLRPVVDQDDAAEGVVARRIREAEARNRPISAADHSSFDKAIRQPETAAAAAAPRYAAEGLRKAFIWREILGPPKSLE